jgi:hypothetical protein
VLLDNFKQLATDAELEPAPEFVLCYRVLKKQPTLLSRGK